MDTPKIALALLSACLALPAAAINKCQTPDGRVTYTDGPCATGSTQTGRVEPLPPVDPADRADALARSKQVVDDARALDAKRDAVAAERQKRYEAERRAEEETKLRQQAADEAATANLYPVPVIVPRVRAPVVPVVKPRPRTEDTDRPAVMGNFPVRR